MISWAPLEVAAREPVLVRRVAPPTAVVWGALWVAAIVAEALALRPVLFDREAPIQGIEVVFTLVGGSFAACGLIAWRRRPDSRSGMLMTATGFLFFVSLSTGADVLIEVAGERDDLAALVSDGAAAGSFEDMQRLQGTSLYSPVGFVMFSTIQVLTGDAPGPPLEEAIERIWTPTLLVSAGTTLERDFNVDEELAR